MGFLDLFRRPTAPTTAPPATSAPPPVDEPVGTGGTSSFGGYPSSNESAAAMRGTARHKTMAEMVANVAIVATAVRRTYRLIGGVDWTMSPARGEDIDETAAKDAAEFAHHAIVNGTRATTPIGKWAKRVASAEFFGASTQAWTMRVDDDRRWPGSLIYDRIDWRPSATIERWDTDANGVVHGVWQRSTDTGAEIYIPRARLVYHVDDELTDSPEGTGLLRHAAETVRRLLVYLSIEGKGYQNSVNGNMVGRTPSAEMKASRMDAAAIAAAEAGLRDYLQNHRKKEDLHLVLDSKTYKNNDGSPSNVPMWSIDTIKADNDLEELGKAIQRDLWMIAVALNVEHVMLGSAGGSLAMQAQKSADYYRFVEGILENIAQVIARDLIDPLWVVNGLDPALKPTPQFSRLSFHDVTELVAMLKDLATAGVTVDRADDAVRAIFEFLGLPVLDDDPEAMAAARADAAAAAGMKAAPLVDPGADAVDVNLDDLED
jgi:hypothetical protein